MGSALRLMLAALIKFTMKEKEEFFANTIDDRMRAIYRAPEA